MKTDKKTDKTCKWVLMVAVLAGVLTNVNGSKSYAGPNPCRVYFTSTGYSHADDIIWEELWLKGYDPHFIEPHLVRELKNKTLPGELRVRFETNSESLREFSPFNIQLYERERTSMQAFIERRQHQGTVWKPIGVVESTASSKRGLWLGNPARRKVYQKLIRQTPNCSDLRE